MRIVRNAWLPSLSLVTAIVLCTACSRPVDPTLVPSPDQGALTHIEGSVVAQEDGAPLAGAHVMAVWTAYAGPSHGQVSGCTWIAAARTDEAGEFSFRVDPARMITAGSGGPRMVHGGRPRLYVYSKAREFSGAEGFGAASVRLERGVPVRVRLPKAVGDSHDRLRSLFMHVEGRELCDNFDNAGALKAYFGAIAVEARTLPTGPYEEAMARAIGYHAKVGFSGDPELAAPGQWKPEWTSLPLDDTGYMELMHAASSGSVEWVTRLLDQGHNPNRFPRGLSDQRGYSPLSEALYGYGVISPVSMKQPGGGPSERNDKLNYIAVVSALLAHPATDPNGRPGPSHPTPLMIALLNRQTPMVQMLLHAGADPRIAMTNRATARSVLQQTTGGKLDAFTAQHLDMLDKWERDHRADSKPAALR